MVSGFGLIFIWAAFYLLAGLVSLSGPLLADVTPPLLLFGLTALTLVHQRAWRQAGRLFRWPGAATVSAGAVAGAGLWLLADAIVLLEQRLHHHLQANNPLLLQPRLFRSPWHLALLVAAVAVLAPFAEELFYRGLVFGWLRERLPLAGAIVASGVAFGLAHLVPTLALPLGVVGCGLAYIYERSRSLWPSMAAHAALNVLSLAFAYARIH